MADFCLDVHRLEAHSGVLANYEVYDLLRSRGVTSDLLGSLGAVTSYECKVIMLELVMLMLRAVCF